jgi:adenylate kinase
MQLILLGPPGSGKGTLADDLSDLYRIPHISTGDLFRDHIKKETKLGIEVKPFLQSGMLVPDSITIAMVEDRLSRPDSKRGYLLDGFPRTVPQAEALDQMKTIKDRPITAVINLMVRDETILRRLSNRRLCSKCGRGYNLVSMPPERDETCDECGGQLIQREDDRPETIKKRLLTYKKQTKPLIAFYRDRDLLVDIDNEGSIEACFIAVRDWLEKNRQRPERL